MAGKQIISIACGGKHTVAVTCGLHSFFKAHCSASGDVYTWGWNWSGQLGHGNLADQYKPWTVKVLALAKLLTNQRCVQVSAGNDHTVALTGTFSETKFFSHFLASGIVYAWGAGQDGQLGNGIFTHELMPVVVLSLHSVRVVRLVIYWFLSELSQYFLWVWPYTLSYRKRNCICLGQGS